MILVTSLLFPSSLLHVNTSPITDALDDAEAALFRLLGGKEPPKTISSLLAVTLASTKIEAITRAVGGACFSDPKQKKAAAGYPIRRRREITAADVNDDLAAVILKNGGTDNIAVIIEELRPFEQTSLNSAGTVSKIITLLESAECDRHHKRLVSVLLAAGHELPPVRACNEISDVAHSPPTAGTAAHDAIDAGYQEETIPTSSGPREIRQDARLVNDPIADISAGIPQNFERLSAAEIAHRKREERRRQ